MAHYSHVISTLIRTEKQALTLSLFGCITFAIFGIGYGLFVGSNAIMLDGIFTLFSMGMTGLGLITAYLVTRPSDARFQYGYAHFEPIANVINGAIMPNAMPNRPAPAIGINMTIIISQPMSSASNRMPLSGARARAWRLSMAA